MATRTTRAKRTAIREGDQYLLRLPPGMRDRLEQRAADNGRPMSAEVIEAIEKHLTGADRFTQLWETFEKHRENIETIPSMMAVILQIEGYCKYLGRAAGDDISGFPSTFAVQKQHDAYVASLPQVTAEQAQTIKSLLKKDQVHAPYLLTAMGAAQIEDIHGFERAMAWIESYRSKLRWPTPSRP